MNGLNFRDNRLYPTTKWRCIGLRKRSDKALHYNAFSRRRAVVTMEYTMPIENTEDNARGIDLRGKRKESYLKRFYKKG